MTATTSEESFESKIAREREEEKERQEKVEALIRGVSKILGFKLEEKEKDSWNYLCLNARKGEESLHFTSGGYQMKDRIKISGNFPKTEKGEYVDPYGYQEKRHEITVSIAKTPEQIARDIERRFLPHYRTLLKGMIERVQKSNEYDRTSVRHLEELKGTELSEEERRGHRFHLSDEIFGEVSVHGETVNIELHSLPLETAKKIMELIV